MGSVGHVPISTCVGCGRKAPKRELVRIALGADGAVVKDLGNSMPGRGAYVCSLECARRAAKRDRRFGRAFRRTVSEATVAALLAGWADEVTIGSNKTEAE